MAKRRTVCMCVCPLRPELLCPGRATESSSGPEGGRGGVGWGPSKEEQTISKLLHVIIKHGLLQGCLVIGVDGVRVGVGIVVSRPRPREGAGGLGVEEGRLVVQGRSASFHHITASPALRGRRRNSTIAGHLRHGTRSVPF